MVFAMATPRAGTVRIGGAKMAKSAGNLVLVRDLVDDHPAAAVRLMILDRPWGEDWEYSPAALNRAASQMSANSSSQRGRSAGRSHQSSAAGSSRMLQS